MTLNTLVYALGRLRNPLAVSLAAASLLACSRPAPEPEPIRAVRTLRVSDGVSAVVKEFAAETRARTESRLAFRVGGKVVSRRVELGEAVRKGQVLAHLDPDDLRQAQEAAAASLAAAQANLELAEADHRRFVELRQQNFISAAELERRSMTLKTARAQVDQARAQATVQRNQTAHSVLVADAPGVVIAVEADAGAVVAAGTPILRIALDGGRDAVFSVPEDVAPGVRSLLRQPGALQVRIWGQTQAVPATLREMAASADPVTRTFQAKADLGAAPVQLGQTASVLLQAPPRTGVFKLPLSAIVRQRNEAAVWVVDPATMTVRQQVVTVQGADVNEAVITAGLTPGQDVVTAGAHVLTPGQKVKFMTPPSPAAAASGPRG